MASAFEKVVRSVVRELDHKELTPVDSLWSSASFQPYSLLSRRPLHSRFWRPRYMCVNLSIRDILEPDAPEPVLECGGTFQFHDAMDGQLQGSVNLEAPGQGRLSGGATVSGSSSASMDLCTLRVAPNTWEAMHHERRLRQPEPKTLQQLRSRGHDVFVVTEVLQTQKEVEVTRTHKQEGLGQFALLGALCLQGKGEGHLSRKKTVTIPSGSTLAFRVAQLVIGSDWDVLLFPDKKQRTFSSLQAGHRPSSSADGHPRSCFSFASMRGFSYSSCQFQSDGSMEHWLATTDDFQGLQAELEQGLCGGQMEPRDGPVGAILESLVLPSGQLEMELADSVFYLLQALAVLSEAQHVLLAEVLETGALSGTFWLVECLVEQSSPWQEHRAVSLPPERLGDSWGSEAPAWALLEVCGLEPQEPVGTPPLGGRRGKPCSLPVRLAAALQPQDWLNRRNGESLVVRWLRTRHFRRWGPGLIPGWGTKIPQAKWPKKIKIKRRGGWPSCDQPEKTQDRG
ncbi:PREDICTED: gasdermin-D isoform X2 [Capra hircus]|uniref:gasdermin-D isoform X2 n=1 Tax=Capra hircus TaxID=9925 RepID=UPI0008472744|nr:PREDICTED: gasdermin-D isoform X2 [Capra hircus]